VFPSFVLATVGNYLGSEDARETHQGDEYWYPKRHLIGWHDDLAYGLQTRTHRFSTLSDGMMRWASTCR
jgi:hypothetical protein